LDLDVLGVRDVAFKKDVGAAECGAGFALRFGELRLEFVGMLNDTHPSSAAAETRLDHQRIADAAGFGGDLRRIGQRMVGSRDGRNAGGLGETLRCRLVAESIEVIRCRSDKRDAGFLAGACQRRTLGKESVSRMDGVDVV
jgi:hypothetical protein